MKSFRTLASLVLAIVVGAASTTLVSASPDADVMRFESAEVTAAFAKGAALVETQAYKVHASRRDAAGAAEIHRRDTDIFYVLEGSAEVVTGGTLRDAEETAPGELRAEAIDGGSARELHAGDVLVIPNGVPHWFRRVDAPIVYYVVKVTSSS